MKKHYTSILLAIALFFSANQAYSQNLNGGFETWITTGSYANPQYWDSPNTETTAIPIVGGAVLTKSSGAHSGSWCARLESKSLLVITVPGVMVLGQMEIDIAGMTGSYSGGAPCNEQVPSLSCYYKYAPVNGDTCGMLAFFTKHTTAGGTDTIGFAFYMNDMPVANWSLLTADVTWTSIETPDTVRIVFFSSAGLNSVAGSVMHVDDLTLDFTSGVSEPLMAEQPEVFFNPNTSAVEVQLALQKPEAMSVNVYNLSGQLVMHTDYGNTRELNTSLDMRNLPKGMYFVALQTGLELRTTKIVNQ